MFETVESRIETAPPKALVKVRFVKTANDRYPRLVVVFNQAYVEKFQIQAETHMGLAIGRDDDAGKLKVNVRAGLNIGKVRVMKLGGAMIDFGAIPSALDMWKIDRPVPAKAAEIVHEDNSSITLVMPVWADDEVAVRKVGVRKGKATAKQHPEEAPAKSGAAAMTTKPMCNIAPPCIIFNGKRATVTEFQAVLLNEMSRNFQALAPASKIITDGYKAVSKPAPSSAELSMPQALMGLATTLKPLGLRVVHVKGQGWGLDVA